MNTDAQQIVGLAEDYTRIGWPTVLVFLVIFGMVGIFGLIHAIRVAKDKTQPRWCRIRMSLLNGAIPLMAVGGSIALVTMHVAKPTFEEIEQAAEDQVLQQYDLQEMQPVLQDDDEDLWVHRLMEPSETSARVLATTHGGGELEYGLVVIDHRLQLIDLPEVDHSTPAYSIFTSQAQTKFYIPRDYDTDQIGAH
ncbi:MAG: hypothetical protein HLX51_00900 [Micrococcaceae bacterium]|nr:hypothetical protein [Micrococcaceae bacterium]